MTEMTERLQSVADALIGNRDVRAHDAARFIAMHDALTAYDAAQKPAEPAAPSDPVATVREAMGRLPAGPYRMFNGETGVFSASDNSPNGHVLSSSCNSAVLATILNALPALLERAEQPGITEAYERQAHYAGVLEGRKAGYRDGLIKGLEMAAARDRAMITTLWTAPVAKHAFVRAGELEAAVASHDADIARIRSGGEIDGETGGTTSGPGARPGQDRRLTAPEGQTQAGGAPGLPAGWIDFTVSTWHPAANNSDMRALTGDDYNRVLRMARDALKMREALIQIAGGNYSGASYVAREALRALEADHG